MQGPQPTDAELTLGLTCTKRATLPKSIGNGRQADSNRRCPACESASPRASRALAMVYNAFFSGNEVYKWLASDHPSGRLLTSRWRLTKFVTNSQLTGFKSERRSYCDCYLCRANANLVGAKLANRARDRTPMPRTHRRCSASRRPTSSVSPRGLIAREVAGSAMSSGFPLRLARRTHTDETRGSYIGP